VFSTHTNCAHTLLAPPVLSAYTSPAELTLQSDVAHVACGLQHWKVR
jgi:hypothetical protein